jgi:hypothetical protein
MTLPQAIAILTGWISRLQGDPRAALQLARLAADLAALQAMT